MKRSEMAAFLRPHPHAEAILRKIDDAGTPWDPEDPPKPKLPARLVPADPFIWEDGNGRIVLDLSLCNDKNDGSDLMMSPREVAILEEAIRAYNLLPAILRRAKEHMTGSDLQVVAGCSAFVGQLVRWIDGTEQPPEAQDER